jgi:hypothetical protein
MNSENFSEVESSKWGELVCSVQLRLAMAADVSLCVSLGRIHGPHDCFTYTPQRRGLL